MIRLKDTTHQHTGTLLADAIRTAEYYGFVPIESVEKRKRSPAAPARPSAPAPELSFARRDERALAQSAKACLSCARGERETLFTWRVVHGPSRERTTLPAAALELHIVGLAAAVAEALLIVIADSIAREAGIASRSLSINSIGSVESSNRFVRDISMFLRKHLESISPVLRPRAATDPLGTLIHLLERGHPATPRAPQAMEYLTEEERRRFWDLLEYLEVYGIPYELSPAVLGSRDIWAHTLFELATTDPETGARIPFALGGRYDPLATRLWGAPAHAATVSILCEVRGKTKIVPPARRAPQIYFAHLGQEARRKVLPTMEMLRRMGIPVHQSLAEDRLGEQMDRARRCAVPILLIMGHKEAVEDAILVREVATNSQETVPLAELPSYLRRFKRLEMAA